MISSFSLFLFFCLLYINAFNHSVAGATLLAATCTRTEKRALSAQRELVAAARATNKASKADSKACAVSILFPVAIRFTLCLAHRFFFKLRKVKLDNLQRSIVSPTELG